MSRCRGNVSVQHFVFAGVPLEHRLALAVEHRHNSLAVSLVRCDYNIAVFRYIGGYYRIFVRKFPQLFFAAEKI